MIRKLDSLFVLETENTSYLFEVGESGHLFQLYYGSKLKFEDGGAEMMRLALSEKCKYPIGNAISYSETYPNVVLENRLLEFSTLGKGDVRTPFIEVSHSDGSTTADYLFESFSITEGAISLDGLPSAYAKEEEAQTLTIVTVDRQYQSRLILNYVVFPKADCIVRNAKLVNDSDDTMCVKRLMSTQLDLYPMPTKVTHFGGSWTNEMNRFDTKLEHGFFVNESMTGTSSSRNNPFIMVSEENCSEDFGLCYGVNLLYSGNHFETVEINGFGKERIQAGINPTGFCWKLEAGESFESPQAVLTVSKQGYMGLSKNMHYFVRNHIVRGTWQFKERPVLLNSWEAAYFKFDEGKLLKMAGAAKKAGVELFVMDDGWFGKRDDDKTSLGDWYVNTKKLPGGVKGLADKIHALGMDFGIWVEPEMVNVESDCFRAHPDWAIQIPGKPHSEGRNQRILDLTRADVCDFVISSMKEVFSSAEINYVKWDMNRIFSDAYSGAIAADRQGEVYHRYCLGLYRILKELTESFPDILFEGCSAGGNRFDLGALCYFPQIWGSDNTDAFCRANIQNGYSYGYPLSTVTSHVSSCPNHQTMRDTPIETRFAVAAAGILGYECNLAELSELEFNAVKDQIACYKKYRKTLQFGNYYRVKNGESTPYAKEIYQWNVVSADKKQAVGVFLQGQTLPHMPYANYRTKGLCEEQVYQFKNRFLQYNVKEFGDLINAVAPIHVKKDSLTHNIIAKVIKMDGEQEDYKVSGSLLNQAGISLRQSFCGTGYDNEVRFFKDYAARIYLMDAVE